VVFGVPECPLSGKADIYNLTTNLGLVLGFHLHDSHLGITAIQVFEDALNDGQSDS